MAKSYSVVTKVTANVTDFMTNMKKAKDSSKELADKSQTNMKKFGKGMKTAGKNLSKYVTAPLAAVGGIAFAAANDIDAAYKTIQTGTGATGEALENLKDNFDNVFTEVPNSADEVANSLSNLNTLTGATGDDLESLSQRVLDASNALNEDGVAASEAFGKAMSQWQIPAEEGAEQLDYLFTLTQDYGVGLGEISGHLTTYGAVLGNAGFEMAESAELMASLEANGISVSRVMPGLNASFRSWADEGKNSREEFAKVVEQIKETEDSQKALSLATETFGAEGAQRLMTAIRNDAIPALDELATGMEGSKGAIAENTEETETFGDKMAELKNKVQIALAPLGESLLQLAEDWLPKVVDAVEKVSTWFNNLSPTMQMVIPIVGMVVAAIPPLIMVIGSIITGLSALVPLFTAAGAVIGAISAPVLIVVGVIAGLVAAGVALYKNWDTVKAKATEIWTAIKEWFSETISNIVNKFTELKDKATQRITELRDQVISKITEFRDNVLNKATEIKDKFVNKVTELKDGAVERFNSLKSGAVNLVTGIKDGIVNRVTEAKDTFVNRVTELKDGAVEKFNDLKSGVKETFENVKDFIVTPIEKARELVGTAVDKITGFFEGIGDKLKIDIPKPKLPRFTITGDFDLIPPDISVPKIGIDWHAKGGIFNKPTLFNTGSGIHGVGEAGAEAIIPLKDSVLGKIGSMISKTMDMDLSNVLSSFADTFNPSNLANAMQSVSPDSFGDLQDVSTEQHNTENNMTVNFSIENMNGNKNDADNFVRQAMKEFQKMGFKLNR